MEECSLEFLELFDLKSKYDESDNLVVRVARTFTDKISGALCMYREAKGLFV